jgi:glyoxylate carboligase
LFCADIFLEILDIISILHFTFYAGGFPALLITGQKPILKSKQGAFQIVNIVEMFRPITKFTKQVGVHLWTNFAILGT